MQQRNKKEERKKKIKTSQHNTNRGEITVNSRVKKVPGTGI